MQRAKRRKAPKDPAAVNNPHDARIRQHLLPHLRDSYPQGLLVQEWGVSSGVRADAAIVHEDSIYAYEIKSARDRLDRLKRQVPKYGFLFPFCTLVVEVKHAAKCLAHLPAWWGVVAIDGAALLTMRGASENPEAHPARLLWASEVRRLVSKHGLQKTALTRELSQHIRSRHIRVVRPTLWTLRETLEAEVPKPQLLREVCGLLRARTNWRLPDGHSVLGTEMRAHRERTMARLKRIRRR